VATDLNGDGKADLAAAGTINDTVAVLFNLGSGSFAEPVVYAVGFNPIALAVADLDGDGAPELAVAIPSAGVDILLNDGEGKFVRGPSYGEGALDLALGDLNGDSMLDLAVANSGSASVLLNHGDGTFGEARYYPARNSPMSIRTSDFNGDGRVDLAVAGVDFSGKDVSLLFNTCLE
jgi:FG-GAP-like repeat